MATLHSDLIIDYLGDDTPSLKECSLVSRALLPGCGHRFLRHVTFYPDNTRCVHFFADEAPLVEELAIYRRRLLGDKGMRTDAWMGGLLRVLSLLASLRRARLYGKMYLDEIQCAERGARGVNLGDERNPRRRTLQQSR